MRRNEVHAFMRLSRRRRYVRRARQAEDAAEIARLREKCNRLVDHIHRTGSTPTTLASDLEPEPGDAT